ncbi:hypothetical protein LM900277_130026 [Listeria monocytogenes]|nr:hypothetical protein LM900277_130026 [Listeria monocytogenes]
MVPTIRTCFSQRMNKTHNKLHVDNYVKTQSLALEGLGVVYIMYVRGSNFVYSLIFMRFYTAHTRRNSPGVGPANLYFS